MYLEKIDEKKKKDWSAFLQRRGYSYDIIKESFEYVTKNKYKGKHKNLKGFDKLWLFISVK